MYWIPYIVAYLGVVVFVIAVIARFIMWSKMPMHVRWELYPVAHEGKRAKYGGSYLEEGEWWKVKRKTSTWGTLKVMIPEMLFLAALFEHNRKLWYRSFPFHFGLYLFIGSVVIMAGGSILAALWPATLSGWLGMLLHWGVMLCGYGGLGLGLLGALGLLHRRLTSAELRDYTSPADIFNLLFFITTFGCFLLTVLWVDREFRMFKVIMYSLVTFSPVALPGTGAVTVLPMISVTLFGLLVAYIPLTHMSHFIGKWFAYHDIRWNDEPNLAGGKQEKIIGKLLSQPVSWAADHIKGDGKKTWVDVATDLPKKEEKK